MQDLDLILLGLKNPFTPAFPQSKQSIRSIQPYGKSAGSSKHQLRILKAKQVLKFLAVK